MAESRAVGGSWRCGSSFINPSFIVTIISLYHDKCNKRNKRSKRKISQQRQELGGERFYLSCFGTARKNLSPVLRSSAMDTLLPAPVDANMMAFFEYATSLGVKRFTVFPPKQGLSQVSRCTKLGDYGR